MEQFETEILINASPKKVWEILIDFENYPQWNPFIKSISGEQEVGKKINVFLQAPDTKGMSFKPVILSFKENTEFRWLGKLGMKGIFDGEHYFKLIDNGNNQTKFIHGENFSGILVSFFTKTLRKTKTAFENMNQSLKKECERN